MASALASIKQSFFPEEFIIDELPVEVYAPPEPDSTPSESNEMGGLSGVAQMFGEQKRDDLLSQMAALLLEQVRLTHKAQELEENRTRDDEFSRFVKSALPFLDNFNRLLEMGREHPPSDELTNWLGSVETLYYRLIGLFENYGLRFINSVGKPVNLDYHEVIEYRATDEYLHNTVMKELCQGIVFRDRLLRDAKVIVACNDTEPGTE